MLTWIKTKHMAAGIVSLWALMAASAASATIITFGSPTNPEGNISYNGGVLSGHFALDEVVIGDKRHACIITNCQFTFEFTGGTQEGNGLRFSGGKYAIDGSEIEGLGRAGDFVGAGVSEVFLRSVGNNGFSVVFGSSQNTSIAEYIAEAANIDKNGLLSDFEFSFLGGNLTDGFSTSDITGGEVVIREAGTTTTSGGSVPAPGGLGLMALAGLALMRRWYSA